MRADILTLLAQDGAKAIHDLRYMAEDEFDEVGVDHLNRIARLLRAVQYSCWVAARRLERAARGRAETPPPDRDGDR